MTHQRYRSDVDISCMVPDYNSSLFSTRQGQVRARQRGGNWAAGRPNAGGPSAPASHILGQLSKAFAVEAKPPASSAGRQ